MPKNTVLSLVGRTKSGKSTIARKLAHYLRTSHIEGSQVIDTLLATDSSNNEKQAEALSRKIKEDKDWFGRELAKVFERKFEDKRRSLVVVSGIRQIETIQYLRDHYNYYGFEVRAEVPVRYDRAISDGKYKNADQFIRGEIRELDLGIQEVEDDAPFAIPTSPLTNPDRIVRATVKILRERNVTLR